MSTEPLSNERIAELRRKLAKATPGPLTMKPMSQHTPEPWEVRKDFNDQPEIYGGDHWIAVLPHQCVTSLEKIANADAARIVACVNACTGIPTDSLTPGLVAEMREALVLCTANCGNPVTNYKDAPEMVRLRFAAKLGIIKSLEAYIASLKKDNADSLTPGLVLEMREVIEQCHDWFKESGGREALCRDILSRIHAPKRKDDEND